MFAYMYINELENKGLFATYSLYLLDQTMFVDKSCASNTIITFIACFIEGIKAEILILAF